MCVESLSPEPEKILSRDEVIKQLRDHLKGWEEELEKLKNTCSSCGKRGDAVKQMEAYGWASGLRAGIRLLEKGMHS